MWMSANSLGCLPRFQSRLSTRAGAGLLQQGLQQGPSPALTPQAPGDAADIMLTVHVAPDGSSDPNCTCSQFTPVSLQLNMCLFLPLCLQKQAPPTSIQTLLFAQLLPEDLRDINLKTKKIPNVVCCRAGGRGNPESCAGTGLRRAAQSSQGKQTASHRRLL